MSTNSRHPHALGFEPLLIEGRTALVMGGTGFIGREIAKGLAAAGAHVIVTSRAGGPREVLAAEIEATGGRCDHAHMDMADADGVHRICTELWDDHGGIDIVVHNAIGSGMRRGAPIASLSAAELAADRAVIFESALAMVQALCPRMVDRGGGSLVMIGSPLATTPSAQYFSYGLAKASITLLARYVAQEFGPQVRANVVNPSFIDTTGEMSAMPSFAAMLNRIPAGRFGRSEECAGAVVFLASPAASFVSGQVVTIDGGRT